MDESTQRVLQATRDYVEAIIQDGPNVHPDLLPIIKLTERSVLEATLGHPDLLLVSQEQLQQALQQ